MHISQARSLQRSRTNSAIDLPYKYIYFLVKMATEIFDYIPAIYQVVPCRTDIFAGDDRLRLNPNSLESTGYQALHNKQVLSKHPQVQLSIKIIQQYMFC